MAWTSILSLQSYCGKLEGISVLWIWRVKDSEFCKLKGTHMASRPIVLRVGCLERRWLMISKKSEYQ